jgi:acetylornithine deacetylase/succinyl-diaminopimelate desuccinylase-like protein
MDFLNQRCHHQWSFGIPVIGFGPGNEVLAHAPNEKVPIDDLVAASAFYAAFAYVI